MGKLVLRHFSICTSAGTSGYKKPLQTKYIASFIPDESSSMVQLPTNRV